MTHVFIASCVASLVVNPLFVLKTRFQTTAVLTDAPQVTYRRLIQNIASGEGVRGFFKGNLVAQVKNTQMVIQMPLFDYLQTAEWNPLGSSNFVMIDRTFVSGVIAKTVASCVIYYPIDSIRTNIRNEVKTQSLYNTIQQIYGRPGGIINFYRGVGVYWISAVPTFGIIMYAYEKLKN
jgi:hypothetical protein